MSDKTTKPFRLAGHLILASISISQAQTLIDVNFPGGTGTNPTFLEIDNAVGDNMWTQESGVLLSATSNNSTAGTASETTIDFTALGSQSLTLTAEVASVSGGIIANGIFIGFQRRINEGTGGDLWNNLPVSFGFVMPGSANVANGVRVVGAGGNAGVGRYQATNYGIATLESIQDGFGVVLTVNSAGWELTITGLEDLDANAITGSSGVWEADGINPWTDFPADMRVGASYQTPAAGGELSFSKINLVTGSGAAPLQILSLVREEDANDPGTTITWNSVSGANYSLDYSTDLINWPEISDSIPAEGETTSFTHSFLPSYPELQDAPKLFYRVRLNP